MKGAIFTGFAEFVEKHYGLTTWLQALEACNLSSNGEYLTTEIYEDSELTTLASYLCAYLKLEPADLYRGYGRYFFSTLMSMAHQYVEDIDNLFDFLIAVDSVIHIEVKKADPQAYTPSLYYDQPQENVLIVRYVSKRKMCFMAEGLILGAADHFQQKITLSQDECTCKGDGQCLIRIVI